MMKFRQPEVPLILDVANMIKPLDPADQAIIVDLLDDDEQAALLVHFVPEYLAGILRQLDDKSVAELVEGCPRLAAHCAHFDQESDFGGIKHALTLVTLLLAAFTNLSFDRI